MATIERRRLGGIGTRLVSAVVVLLIWLVVPTPFTPSGGAMPTTVTVVGSLQSELGCPGDWNPSCAVTRLTFDLTDGVWQGTFTVPPGSYEYKVALNQSFDVNYGANATPNGRNIALNLATPTMVTFLYDDATHWIADNVNKVIATAVGSFQSELGCPGDWDPGCLRSWLEDPDGDGTYTFATSSLPPGNYEAKVAINQSFDVNYGAGGVPGGANIAFNVPGPQTTYFIWDSTTHVLTIIGANGAPPSCTRSLTGNVTGPVTVAAGESVCIANARVVGPITVNPGGALTVDNSRVTNGVAVNGAAFIRVCGSQVAAPMGDRSRGLAITNTPVSVRIGDPAAGCAANTVAGDVMLTGNTAGVALGANTVAGNVTVNNNAGPTVIKANQIQASLACADNSPVPTNVGQPNTAGTKTGQCAGL